MFNLKFMPLFEDFGMAIEKNADSLFESILSIFELETMRIFFSSRAEKKANKCHRKFIADLKGRADLAIK